MSLNAQLDDPQHLTKVAFISYKMGGLDSLQWAGSGCKIYIEAVDLEIIWQA